MTDLEGFACEEPGERQILCVTREIQAAETDYDVNYLDELRYVVVAEDVSWNELDYQRVSASEAEPTFAFTALREQHQPLIVESDVTYPNVILEEGTVNYIHVPGWLRELVASFETQNEHYAYRFPGFTYRDRSTFAIGASAVRTLGAAVDFQSDFGLMRRSYRHANGMVTVETTVEMPNRVVSLDEMKSFNAFLNVIRDNATVRFRFDPRIGGAP